MTPLDATGAAVPRPVPPEYRELRHACQEMEAVFFRQLLEAMRSETTDAGSFAASEGESMFTALLDDQVASEAAQQSTRGLGETLYRQLVRHLEAQGPDPRR